MDVYQAMDCENLTLSISQKYQELFRIYQEQGLNLLNINKINSAWISDSMSAIFAKIASDPASLVSLQQAYMQELNVLFKQNFTTQNEPKAFEFLQQCYALWSKYCSDFIKNIASGTTLECQLNLYLSNFIAALDPANYPFTNPELIFQTMNQGGINILHGINNYLDDLIMNQGQPNFRLTDLDAFSVGHNIATTDGVVIYQNTLMQLIAYTPTCEYISSSPILFIPPWINKFYILDLNQEKSLVKYLLDQGFMVFMISWVNPDPSLRDVSFEDYMLLGPLEALDILKKLYSYTQIHMVGYCIGGTLLACTLAYMRKNNAIQAKTATYLTTMLDFSSPGDLGAFVNEKSLALIEEITEKTGILDGRILSMVFNLLRPKDLIWPQFINNYLEGKKPTAFDLLYWNADATNLPHRMCQYYLREMYLHNNLIKPNKLILNGCHIDITTIDIPAFFLSCEKDHIAPWQSTFAGASLHKSLSEFVLSGSGHIAGVINPPKKHKYHYYTNKKLHKTHATWLETANFNPGSWWPYWVDWLKARSLKAILSKQLPKIPPIEGSPGSYAKRSILNKTTNETKI